jgi:DeoR family ulaG and ulaABCDEF operon transcriptional repressor
VNVRSIDASAPPLFDAQKRAIARAGADLISNMQPIIITGGTTTLAFAQTLSEHCAEVFTHSLEIASTLLQHGHSKVTMPGGTIYRERDIVLDAFGSNANANACASAEIAFTSCHAISKWGMTETDPFVARAQSMILSRAQKIVVLADSSKIRRTSSIVVADLSRVSVLITDDGVEREDLSEFQAAGVRVIVAAVNYGS